MTGGTVADSMSRTAIHIPVAIQGLGHEKKVPFPGPRFVDRILPEFIGQALGKVTTQTRHSKCLLLFSRLAARQARFLEPVERIVREVVPKLFGLGIEGFEPVVFT